MTKRSQLFARRPDDFFQAKPGQPPQRSNARSAVERELVLRLASLLWRLRRATAIESGLFKIQAKHLLQFRQRRQFHQDRKIIDSMYPNATGSEYDLLQEKDESISTVDTSSPSSRGGRSI
jgi:hypothetical protein